MCKGSKGNKQALAQQQAANDALIAQVQQQQADSLAQAQAQSAAAQNQSTALAERIAEMVASQQAQSSEQTRMFTEQFAAQAAKNSEDARASSAALAESMAGIGQGITGSIAGIANFMKEQALNNGNAKKAPNLGVIGRKVTEMYRGSKTMLTGPGGVSQGMLSLGRNTLLGSASYDDPNRASHRKVAGNGAGLAGVQLAA